MTHQRVLSAVLILLVLGCASVPEQTTHMPEDVIREGTLCDARLIHDTKVGIVTAIRVMGCSTPERITPYIRAMPTGSPGARSWRETWVVFGCGKQYPIRLLFQENQMGVQWTMEDEVPVDPSGNPGTPSR